MSQRHCLPSCFSDEVPAYEAEAVDFCDGSVEMGSISACKVKISHNMDCKICTLMLKYD